MLPIGCWRLPLRRTAGLAALWGGRFWCAITGCISLFLPIILTIAIAFHSEGPYLHRIGHFLIFVLVTGGIVGGYIALNWYRTGEAFFSIAGGSKNIARAPNCVDQLRLA